MPEHVVTMIKAAQAGTRPRIRGALAPRSQGLILSAPLPEAPIPPIAEEDPRALGRRDLPQFTWPPQGGET